MSSNRQYLGDGVYADFDGYHIVLTTEDGHSVTNTIYLEQGVYNELERYVACIAQLPAERRTIGPDCHFDEAKPDSPPAEQEAQEV